MRTALVDALLLDGHGGPPRPGTTLVVDGARIAEVGHERAFGPDVRVVDLAGRAVMPGLVDCHVHLAPWAFHLVAHAERRLTYLAAETVRALRLTLEGGCTTARDLGGLDAGFRDAVHAGLVAGPRLQVSLVIVSPTHGMADLTTPQGFRSPLVPGMPDPECNGPDAVRAKVREVLRAGADVVKVAVSGGVSAPRLEPQRPLFTPAEIAALVDEAHLAGTPVACHAVGGPHLLAAVRAGVDTIEHGAWLDDETVAEMARRGTWYVPTFAIYRWHATRGAGLRQSRARALAAAHRESFARARAAGVRVALGTDSGAYGHGETALELALLVEAGMSPAEAIVAGTRRAAECLGVAGETGTLERGRAADLLVLEGNPLDDIGLPGRPEGRALVLRGGRPVGGTRRVAWFGEAALDPAPAAPA
jgi:imidazolonepropionase-like amidohydrolase